MKHRIRALFLALGLLFGVVPARADLLVVSTTTDLASVASAIGGGRVKVQALALPTQDPHWVDARPNLALTLSNADMLIAVGAELEVGWLPTLQVGSRNPKVQVGAKGFLDCSQLVDLRERPQGKVDRSMGDIHPSGNPHYMLDPRAVERVAVGIGKRMAELDPGQHAAYLENTKKFVDELRKARARWETKLKALRGREGIAFHRSLSYLADWVGFAIIDHIEPKPGIPPSPKHIAEVIEHAKQHKVRAILQETWHPTKTSDLVAQKVGAKLVRLPGGPKASGQSYIAFMDQVTKQLAEAL